MSWIPSLLHFDNTAELDGLHGMVYLLHVVVVVSEMNFVGVQI